MRVSGRAPALQGGNCPVDELRMLLHEPDSLLMQHQALQILEFVPCIASGNLEACCTTASRAGMCDRLQFIARQKSQIARIPESAHHAYICAHGRRWGTCLHRPQRHAGYTRTFGQLRGRQPLLQPGMPQPFPQLEKQLAINDGRELGTGWHL